MDIKLHISEQQKKFDIVVENGDLAIDRGLETAVYISLFSWARAKAVDDVPEGTSKFGWWGDQVSDDMRHRTGSRLWLMPRRKLTQATINNAVQHTKECLNWMLSDGVVSSVDIIPETKPTGEMDIIIRFYRYGEQVLELRYNKLWEQMGEGNDK